MSTEKKKEALFQRTRKSEEEGRSGGSNIAEIFLIFFQQNFLHFFSSLYSSTPLSLRENLRPGIFTAENDFAD